MKKILDREQLIIKYVEYPVLEISKEQTKENYIQFYKDHIKLLNELKEELKEIRKHTTKTECNYNYRQKGCIDRIHKEDLGWENENNRFRQRIYELTDFIFYSHELEYADKYLTIKEIDEIFKMIDYLVDLAQDRLNFWKK